MEERINSKLKKQKGITLIALVVTIVVLIMLATISIQIIFNEDGIMRRAESTISIQDLAKEQERLELVKTPVAIDNGGKIPLDKYVEELIKEGIVAEGDVTDNEDGSKQVITDNGYNVNIKQDGEYNVIITIEGKEGQLPVKIEDVKLTTSTDSIKVDVQVKRGEGASYKYYYKTENGEYILAHEGPETSYTIEKLEQNTTYTIKVEATNENGTVFKEAVGRTEAIADAIGAIEFGQLTWNAGKASVTVTKNITDNLMIEYKINTGSYQRIESGSAISNLDLDDVVTVRLTDGTNYGNTATLNVMDTTDPTVSVAVGEITSNSIELKVTASDGESGLATSETYKYYLNNELKDTNTTNSYIYTGLTDGTTYTLKVAVTDRAGNTIEKDTTAATIEKPIYIDASLPTAPKLAEGMTPVKWNGSNWVRVSNKSEWYDYDKKEWANVVLGDATFNSDGTLDESKPYSQLVWIPRYAYQITTQYHTATSDAGNINVVFVDTNNQNKNKSTTYKSGAENYPSATAGATTGMSDYIVHPAFDYGGTKLSGFWIGKFESSNAGNNVIAIKANVSSWRNIDIGTMYDTCLGMNKAGNPYGLTTADEKIGEAEAVDPHLTKNSEWGAVAYLSKSKYGKQTEEVYINNNISCITGIAGGSAGASSSTSTTNKYNTTAGMKASTSGTIYGVYDMSGCIWEYVAGYVNNGNSNLTSDGSSLVNGASKYKDVYTSSGDTQSGNYGVSTPANGHYGDAVYETSSSGSENANSWYSDYSDFPYSSNPFFVRGGGHYEGSNAGVFLFDCSSGGYSIDIGFRVVVPVL